jgi:hypothetical protein
MILYQVEGQKELSLWHRCELLVEAGWGWIKSVNDIRFTECLTALHLPAEPQTCPLSIVYLLHL